MATILCVLCSIFAFFWALIATFTGVGFIDEKRESKDGSWKFFFLIFMAFAATAIVFAGTAIYLCTILNRSFWTVF